MKKDNEQQIQAELADLPGQNDELRPEYDLSQLQVRRLGPGRRQFGDHIVRLEPDVAAVFQDANAVNEALRLLIKVAQSSNQPQQGI
ncbi:MAG: hypothetical protein ACKVZH_21650 [Blastocatellia bacterium]